MRHTRNASAGTLLPALLLLGLLGACGGGDGDAGRRVAEPKEGDPVVALAGLSDEAPYRLAGGDTLQIGAPAREFYEKRRGAVAWVKGDELTRQGRAVLAAIGRAGDDGLAPETYHYSALKKMEARLDGDLPDTEKAKLAADLDLALTEGFVRLTSDMVSGTLDPQEAGLDWRIPRGRPMEQRILDRALTGTPPSKILAALRPAAPEYQRLRAALAQYEAAARRGGWRPVPDAGLKPGVRDSAVVLLRQRLMNGVDRTEAALARRGASNPTLFDASLKQAVAHLQKRHGIEADGVPGGKTLQELNSPVEERISEIKLNLDRWRWLPRNLGPRYLLVNIAGFELELVDRGKVIEAMNVVVGQSGWETPVMADTMENIVVNPYWNVPPSILEEEIKPAMAADPGYLERHNYEWVGDRLRQRPGGQNALGHYKFVFPNTDDIYLHDTPADNLFSETRRDFSHGCIRLERPAELAQLLVRLQTKRDPAQLDELVASGEERWVKLDRKLPVYLLYFTAWVGEDGVVQFHHDIYGRDEKLDQQTEDKLNAPPAAPARPRAVAMR